MSQLHRGALAMAIAGEDTPYKNEQAAGEAIADADDPRQPLAKRVEAREALLERMGRLDRALRHVRSMEAARARWTEQRR